MKRLGRQPPSASSSKRGASRQVGLLVALSVLTSASWAANPPSREPPRPINRTVPTYPDELYRTGVEGDVDVVFEVAEDGGTQNAEVRFATHPEFGQAAVDAVLTWRFEPGRRDGKPARFRVVVPFNFRMPQADPLSRWAGRSVFRPIDAVPVEAASLDAWPQPARWIHPPYPNALRGSGKRGNVVVQFVVDEFGEVINPEVLQNDDPQFVAAALATAVSLRFPPHLTPDGVAVPVQMAVLFTFDEKRQRNWERAVNQKRIR